MLEPRYDPKGAEAHWYAEWLARGYFHGAPSEEHTPYSIVIPPPNVTGSLHMGHALNNTLQDVLVRWKRMSGLRVCWMPGTDHAGIATQNVVERQLAEENLSREALGREKFIERVWKWKAESGGTIIRQLHRLGASCDWERERFTMDEGLSRAVREAFVLLYEKGLIYRDDYLVNWCPRCETAVSDLEVEHEDHDGPPVELPLPPLGGRRGRHHRHHAPRDHARRHRRGRPPRGRTLRAPRGAKFAPAASGQADSPHRRFFRGPRLRLRGGKGNARARPERL